jgi:16S rRNA C967 or C1407 C5-methylase (RsmB/RsmF family)
MLSDQPRSSNLPNTARKLAGGLFADAAPREAFLHALATPQDYSPALVWLRERPECLPFEIEPPYPWQPSFVDRVAPDQRPGQDPLHETGHYYCLDFSSVFTACIMQSVPAEPPLTIDVCASPGGKSVFAWRLLRPQLLVANEVIGKRTAALISNLRRCRIHPAVVASMDSSRLADAWPGAAQLVIVDAPCSGQSLIARGKKSPGCFHPATINMNANRQRRILAHAAKLVAPGGHLAYITCTYSYKENENNVLWLRRTRPEFQAVEVPALSPFQSHLAEFACYRLWPQDGIGAGGFAAILQNREDGFGRGIRQDALRVVWSSEG